MGQLKGKLVVGQSGGCTQVINSSLRGVVEAGLKSKSVTAVWGMRHGIEGALEGDFIDLGREDAKTLSAIGLVPAAALGSCRRKLNEVEAEDIVRLFARNDIRFFTYIGGNDSADTSHRICQAAKRLDYDMRVVAVPKTIDNDLPVTHHCPGYGSTARFIASVVADTGVETESMRNVEPVKIVEVFGRNAGWLAAAAALPKRCPADAPHLIWPPEVPFEAPKFIQLVRRALKSVGHCVAVVSETIRDKQGNLVGPSSRKVERDGFGHPRSIGPAEAMCELVKENIGVRARWDKPGTIQRMASAYFSPSDLREARACGQWAVRFALQGRSDCMVVMKKSSASEYLIGYGTAPIAKIANREKLLPASYFNRNTMMPTAAFLRYAAPLIGEGLPRHARLKGLKVKGLK